MVVDLFAFLVTPTGTKISQKEDDLISLTKTPAPRVKWFLAELVKARLLRVTDPPERYEIFHDALAKPFLDARNDLVLKRATEAQDAEVKRVQALADAQRARAEAETQRATEQKIAARKFKMLAAGMAVLAALAVAAGIYAVLQARKAEQLTVQANQLSQQLDSQRKGLEEVRTQTSELSKKQQDRIDELIAQLSSTESGSAADRKRLEGLMAENEAAKRQLSRLDTSANAYTKQVSIPNSNELTDVKNQLQKALADKANLERQLKSAPNDSAIRSDRDTARSERDAALADVKRLTEELRLARVEIDRLNAELAKRPRGDNTPETQEQLGGDFRSLYQNAMNMFDRQQWKQAATGFAAAARLQDDSTDTLAIGGRRVQYLPTFYLGLSYRQMGQCAQAAQAWDRSEKRGVIKSGSREAKAIQDGRAACQGKY